MAKSSHRQRRPTPRHAKGACPRRHLCVGGLPQQRGVEGAAKAKTGGVAPHARVAGAARQIVRPANRVPAMLPCGLVELRLYIIPGGPRSGRAVIAVRRLCDQWPPTAFRLAVLDLWRFPLLALEDRVLVVPTLVVSVAHAQMRLCGDLTNLAGVATWLARRPTKSD